MEFHLINMFVIQFSSIPLNIFILAQAGTCIHSWMQICSTVNFERGHEILINSQGKPHRPKANMKSFIAKSIISNMKSFIAKSIISNMMSFIAKSIISNMKSFIAKKSLQYEEFHCKKHYLQYEEFHCKKHYLQ